MYKQAVTVTDTSQHTDYPRGRSSKHVPSGCLFSHQLARYVTHRFVAVFWCTCFTFLVIKCCSNIFIHQRSLVIKCYKFFSCVEGPLTGCRNNAWHSPTSSKVINKILIMPMSYKETMVCKRTSNSWEKASLMSKVMSSVHIIIFKGRNTKLHFVHVFS